MKKTNKRPQFFALYKDFNNGAIKTYDVLQCVFDSILNTKGGIKKKDFFILDKKWNRVDVRTKEQCEQFVSQILRYYFWSKCEWEFVCLDWPYRDTIKESNPVKIDVYDQLEPNLQVINDLVWNYIEPKVKKLIKEENE